MSDNDWFQSGSIGVAYLQKENINSTELKLVLPRESGLGLDPIKYLEEKIVVNFNGEINLFDSEGILWSGNQDISFEISFWCENDGGIQFRPSAILSIDNSELKRKLISNYEIQDIAAFVILNPSEEYNAILNSELETKDIRLIGDLDGDGRPEAAIHVYPDEAQNCGDLPDNNLVVRLLTHELEYSTQMLRALSIMINPGMILVNIGYQELTIEELILYSLLFLFVVLMELKILFHIKYMKRKRGLVYIQVFEIINIFSIYTYIAYLCLLFPVFGPYLKERNTSNYLLLTSYLLLFLIYVSLRWANF